MRRVNGVTPVAHPAKTPASGRKRNSLAAQDWVEAAIEQLSAGGPSALSIAALARSLGVTPGSFYWHFRDRDDLRDRVLEHWKNQLIVGVVAAARRSGKGSTQIQGLPKLLIARKLPDLDVAMRAWARKDAVVAAAVAKTDELRIRAMTAMFKNAGLDTKRAQQRALQLAWAFRGSAGVEQKQRLRVLQGLVDLLVLDCDSQRR